MRSNISKGWRSFWHRLGNGLWSILNWVRERIWRRQPGGYTQASQNTGETATAVDTSLATMLGPQASAASLKQGETQEDVEAQIVSPPVERLAETYGSTSSQVLSLINPSPAEVLTAEEEKALLKKAHDALILLKMTLISCTDIEAWEIAFERGGSTQEKINQCFDRTFDERLEYYQNFVNAGGMKRIEKLHMEILGKKGMTYDQYKKDLPTFEAQLQPLLTAYDPEKNPLPTGITSIGQGKEAISLKRLQCRLTLVWTFLVKEILEMYQKSQQVAQENERCEKLARDARASRIQSTRRLEESTRELARLKAETAELRRLHGQTGKDRDAEKETSKHTGNSLGTVLRWSFALSTAKDKLPKHSQSQERSEEQELNLDSGEIAHNHTGGMVIPESHTARL